MVSAVMAHLALIRPVGRSGIAAVQDARFAAAPRQPKSCDGEISSDRANTEILTPGSNDAAIARSLKSSDHRRRSPRVRHLAAQLSPQQTGSY
jgi:hypothetical protein